jgi:uncharacterized protein (UPF0332 family)
MDGRAFLQSARALLATPSEANRRSAVGRAYYALLHEARAALERWGFPCPAHGNLHLFVKPRFVFSAQPDAKNVGITLDRLSGWRNQADYRLTLPGPFAADTLAGQALALAEAAIDLLDQIEADPARRAAAVAAVRKAFP